MIKDGKFVCSDFPQYEINWGLLNPESEKKIKEWLKQNTINLCSNVKMRLENNNRDVMSLIKTFVDEVYDQIHQVGYEEGYDSAQCDNEGEGL